MAHKGMIDSINFSNVSFIGILNNDKYVIEPIKGLGVFEPNRWIKTFGKSLTKNIIEAKILHTEEGLELPLKRYSVSPKKETLEFGGVNGYNEKAILLKQLLHELENQLQDSYVVRIDIAIDFNGKIPNNIIKELCRTRKPFVFKNTTYYKTEKEKKTNTWIDIKKYNKSLKDRLGYPLERLEFVFKGCYFDKLQFKDLEQSFKRMEKSIKKFAKLTVKIQSI